MRNDATFWLLPALIILAFMIMPIVIVIGNEAWNCTSWHNATGDKTKLIAGSCYVYNVKHKQYETFTTYTSRKHIGISDETETDDE